MKNLWTPWRMAYIKRERDAKAHCVFCDMAGGCDDDGLVIAHSAHTFVTLNKFPYNYGHVMVLPYAHVPSPEDLDSEVLMDLMCMTNRSMRVLRELAGPSGFNIGANVGRAAGAGIAEHYHFHVVPRWEGDSNFMGVTAGTRLIPSSLAELRQDMQSAWDGVYGTDKSDCS